MADEQIEVAEVVKGGPGCVKAILCGYRLANSARNIEMLTGYADNKGYSGDIYEAVKLIDIAEESSLAAEELLAKMVGAVLPKE